MSIISENRIQIGAYCSPQPACSVGGVDYPSKINLKVYEKLAELGVTVIYGHAEAIGRENENFVFESLDLAEKVGIKYFVRDMIAERYVSLGFREYPDWRKLSEQQKTALDDEFVESINKYKNYPAFAGISFYDEAGFDSFDGIARAKKVFKSVCPDKVFYVNNLPHHITAKQLQYGACQIGVPEATDENLAVRHGNVKRYEYFTRAFINKVHPEVYSYDSYPFIDLGGIKTNIHTSLYELQQICAENEIEYGVPFWVFMQIGGKWEGSLNRVTRASEMNLQFNVSLAFGASGVQLFPCCFPNDWLSDPLPEAGVIGRNGEETPSFALVKKCIKQVKAVEKYLAHAKRKGIYTQGRYYGLLPPEEQLQKIEWNETIYRGGLSEEVRLPKGEMLDIECDSQVLVGSFEKDDTDIWYIVNNSIVTETNVRVSFGKEREAIAILSGEERVEKTDSFYFQRVEAGDGILIALKKQ